MRRFQPIEFERPIDLVSKMFQLRHISSQMWQERRLCHRCGKRDILVENVARETLTWKERCQRGKTDVIGQHVFFFYQFHLFCDNMDNFVHNAANKTSEFLSCASSVVAPSCSCVSMENWDWMGSKLSSSCKLLSMHCSPIGLVRSLTMLLPWLKQSCKC